MQLKIVNASQGVRWMQDGFAIFLKQPLALGVLPFFLVVLFFVIGSIPVLGVLLHFVAVPAATAGLMFASRTAAHNGLVWPSVLFAPLKATQGAPSRLLVLGIAYALLLLAALGLTWFIDGGLLLDSFLMGKPVDEALMRNPAFANAGLLFGVLLVPMSMMFWFSPVLVSLEGQTVGKALFFSFMACFRNWRAFVLFMFAWLMTIFMVLSLFALLIAMTFGDSPTVQLAIAPIFFLLITIFIVSTYPSYRDTLEPNPHQSHEANNNDANSNEPN
jgi:hypothetical protein